MKTYLLIYNAVQLAQSDLTKYLDTRPEIRNWYVPFLGSMLLVAHPWYNVSSLSTLIHNRFPDAQIAVADVAAGTANGWMPSVFWELISSPKESGKWAQKLPSGNLADLMRSLGADETKK